MSTRGTGNGTQRRNTSAPNAEEIEERMQDATGRGNGDESEGNAPKGTPKKRGRPKGSTNKTKKTRSKSRTPQRTRSQTPSRRTTKQAKETTEVTTPTTPRETPQRNELSGSTGRAIKQEILDHHSSKIQQTLGFPIIPTVDLTKIRAPPSSAERPIEIVDDQEDDRSQTSRTKRKQDDIVRGDSTSPEGTPRRKPRQTDEVEHVRTRMANMGRGNISGRGRGNMHGRGRGGNSILPPPETNSTARAGTFVPSLATSEKTFTPSEDSKGCTPTEIESDSDTPIKQGRTQAKISETKQYRDEQPQAIVTSQKVTNPYRTQRENNNKVDAATTPRVTYASVTKSPQTKIKTHSKIKEAHETYFEVTFDADEMSNNPSMPEIIANHKATIKHILKRAKEIDGRAKINTWKETSDLPTLVKVEDIPDDIASMSAYLFKKGSQISKGKNRNWQIKITTHITSQEFVHLWGLSKRDYTRVPFVTLRSAPLQAPTYHAAGFFINSSDNQLVEQLEEEISKQIGHQIGIAYKPAAIVNRAAKACWAAATKAKQKAPPFEKNRVFFRNAPMAMQVYAESRDEALVVAQKLSERYGSVDADRMYPRLPDGTRMRFVAAHPFLDMQGSTTAANLFQQQILLQKYEVTAAVPIRDPFQRFSSHNNKTMHELVMDLRDPEQNNEPYFRNMRKKYNWNFKTKEWEVSMHSGMYASAAKILRRFKEHMTEQYGDEVGDAIKDGTSEEGRHEFGSQSGATSTGISISTEDRYLNGDGHFIILGIEKLEENMREQTIGDIRMGGDDENTMNVKSTTSGLSGNTGNTVPSIPGMDERSVDPGSIDPGGKKQGEGTTTTRETDDPSAINEATSSEAMQVDDDDTIEQDEGRWEQVTSKKGAKPRPPTMSEKMMNMAASLSGFMGGGHP